MSSASNVRSGATLPNSFQKEVIAKTVVCDIENAVHGIAARYMETHTAEKTLLVIADDAELAEAYRVLRVVLPNPDHYFDVCSVMHTVKINACMEGADPDAMKQCIAEVAAQYPGKMSLTKIMRAANALYFERHQKQ